ncbi:hypothetical protein [Pseudoalteromonas rubra]|uniref:Sodium:solute symporter n=1 Tax=Pseudoalteromonas rubra TaxID=43658 RepID=A0A0F4QHD8_9GAMM|nr:hypothetical protein [Pseudoalteromonas rubra]KJZ06744.1 hypothetical protein TW77_18240 [Pseudoalteromonas rubra]
MDQIIQLLSIIGMFFLSYVGLRAFGKPTTKLLFDPEEKRQWNTLLKSNFGNWLTGTNIVGTLTSFATVLVFFLGNAKVFGIWVLICSVSIFLGGYVTNYFTGKISELKRVKCLLSSSSQTGGVLASLCWENTKDGKLSSILVKYISMTGIAAVIWLEFALFSDIGGQLFGFSEIWMKSIILAFSSFAVIFFVLRYGIRGFAFTDIFQTPIIALCAFLLVCGSIWLALNSSVSFDSSLIAPIVDAKTITLFVIHVLFLNAFLVLATEPHWLRLWVFQEKETKTQIASTFSTAIIWAVLVGIGFIGSSLAQGEVGPGVIVTLVTQLSNISPVFLIIFWFAAVAALFTTCDAQSYSWLVVKNYDTNTGSLQEYNLEKSKPFLYALISAIVFTAAYFVLRTYEIPFEKLVFLIIPFALNTLPAIVQLAFHRQPTPYLIIISVIFFILFAAGGFIQPNNELLWTLVAALVPVVISVVSPFIGKKMGNEE